MRPCRPRFGTFGKLDVLVDNAGYGNVAPIEDTTLEELRAQIETNTLLGDYLRTKAVLPYFRGAGSQATSCRSLPSQVASDPLAAHRMRPPNGAWRVFPQTPAKEVRPFGVKVTLVEPGDFRTDFPQDRQRNCGKDVPNTMRRSGKTEPRFTAPTKTESNPATRPGLQPALLKFASVEGPPLRIVLGIDTCNATEATDLAKNRSRGEKWKDISATRRTS